MRAAAPTSQRAVPACARGRARARLRLKAEAEKLRALGAPRSGLYWTLPRDRVRAAIRDARESGLIGPRKTAPVAAPRPPPAGGAAAPATADAAAGARRAGPARPPLAGRRPSGLLLCCWLASGLTTCVRAPGCL